MSSNNTQVSLPYFCVSIWPLDIPFSHLVTFACSQAILCPFTIISNSLLVYALVKTRQLNSISNKLILMMNISDLCMGVLGQPLIVIMVSLKRIFRNCAFEKFVQYIVFLSANFSWFMLLCIAIDRYFSITKLNRYNLYMNNVRMKILIIVSFIIANILAATLHFAPSFDMQVVFNVANITMMIVVSLVYVLILQKLKAHSNKLAFHMKTAITPIIITLHPVRLETITEVEEDVSGRSAEVIQLPKRSSLVSKIELSATKTIQTLLFTMFALYSPYNIVSAYWAYFKYEKRENPSMALNISLFWTYFIVLSNASVNACIIINGNSKTRKFILTKLRLEKLQANRVSNDGQYHQQSVRKTKTYAENSSKSETSTSTELYHSKMIATEMIE